MKTVYKYPLEITDEQKIVLPAGAKILCIKEQDGVICLWALVDNEQVSREVITIRCAGTGHPVEEDVEYIDSVVMMGGDLVFHFFKVIDKKNKLYMTNEEKQLLLKDLCGRLPYNVNGIHRGEVHKIKNMDGGSLFPSIQVDGYDAWFPVETFKPYLRSMSSMTEEEKKQFFKLKQMSVTIVLPNANRLKTEYIVDLDDDGDGLNHLYDWLNYHHFDHRNLIEKGLALEAPEGMYK